MIESIEFTNFKALRRTALPLAPFTLLLGPNGSGKSSVLQALAEIARLFLENRVRSPIAGQTTVVTEVPWKPVPCATTGELLVEMRLRIRAPQGHWNLGFKWDLRKDQLAIDTALSRVSQHEWGAAWEWVSKWLASMRTYSLDPLRIASPVPVSAGPMSDNGTGLPAVLDELKDNHPERWNLLLDELRKWLPEYDHIQFIKPSLGHKGIALRTKKGGHCIPASELSQGSLVALALLTLAYLPNPPSLIGLEEIDRGLHPRLLRHLQDALYRLSYPESCGEKRPPIQVIATTHSPYLLDLYRDRPEEVVIAHKEGLEVQFRRLSDVEHFGDILGDSPLSEVWYSGVLGGVSVKP